MRQFRGGYGYLLDHPRIAWTFFLLQLLSSSCSIVFVHKKLEGVYVGISLLLYWRLSAIIKRTVGLNWSLSGSYLSKWCYLVLSFQTCFLLFHVPWLFCGLLGLQKLGLLGCCCFRTVLLSSVRPAFWFSVGVGRAAYVVSWIVRFSGMRLQLVRLRSACWLSVRSLCFFFVRLLNAISHLFAILLLAHRPLCFLCKIAAPDWLRSRWWFCSSIKANVRSPTWLVVFKKMLQVSISIYCSCMMMRVNLHAQSGSNSRTTHHEGCET